MNKYPIINLIEMFLEDSQVSKNSEKTYWYILKAFAKWIINKGLIFHDLKKVDLINWRSDLVKTKSSLTVSSYVIIVKMFYKWLELNGYGNNLAKILKVPPKYKGFKKLPLSIDNIKKLFESVDQSTLIGKRDFALLNLLIRNGLRIIEVQRINIEDISETNGRHIIYLQRKGSKDKHDITVLSDKTLEAIHDYMEAREVFSENSPLFISLSLNNYGNYLNTKSISHIVKAYLKGIGLNNKKYTAHSLRHTAGVLALKNNVGEYATQIYLNHKSFSTTQLYLRSIENELLFDKSPALLTDNMY